MCEEDAGTTVLWRVFADAATCLAILQDTVDEKIFKINSTITGELRVTVRASVLKRRRRTMLTGFVSRQDEMLEIAWPVSSGVQREHLLSLEGKLPDGVMNYNGLVEAASCAGFTVGSRAALRNVANSLARHEVVTAAGQGRLADSKVVVALTARRLLVVEGTALAPALINLSLDKIDRLLLGKKKTGELIRLGSEQESMLVSHLGHGEGYGVVSTFRQLKKDMERPPSGHS